MILFKTILVYPLSDTFDYLSTHLESLSQLLQKTTAKTNSVSFQDLIRASTGRVSYINSMVKAHLEARTGSENQFKQKNLSNVKGELEVEKLNQTQRDKEWASLIKIGPIEKLTLAV